MRFATLVAAIVLCLIVAAFDAATAQTVNPNPGTATVVTESRSQTQTITPQTVTREVDTSATRIIGQLAGKPPVYDQTFNAAFNDPQVQAGIAQARAAITSAGGSGTAISGPTQTGQTQNTTTSSSTADTVTGSSTTVTTVTTFGPAMVFGCNTTLAIAVGCPAGDDFGLCTFGGASASPAFPMGQFPSGCQKAPNFMCIATQLCINANVNTDTQITRTTTVTTTVVTTTTYVLTGTPAVADFSLTSTAHTVTLRPGQTGVFPLTVTAVNGYAQSVALTCTGLPDNAACAFAPASVTPSGSGAASTLSITTQGPNAGTVNAQALLRAAQSAVLFGSLGGVLLLRGRRTVALALGAIVLAGCGGGGGSGSPVAPIRTAAQATTSAGTTTVNVIAKGADGTTHTLSLTLVVSP